ncbi:hypothetical protein TNCV_188161 [Trichonephila clavipes]|nr:hypothetical protein TNCV_188161 [Trichonephila clavipes]
MNVKSFIATHPTDVPLGLGSNPGEGMELRLTAVVHLALHRDEFRGPRSDYVRQVALATTTTQQICRGSKPSRWPVVVVWREISTQLTLDR